MEQKFKEAAPPQRQYPAHALKGWAMIILTSFFVAVYGAALVGLLKPLADDRAVSRLELITFVIIGYYFGRLPAQQNEKALKEEIIRQTQKADAAQHAKEQVQQEREALEERVKGVRAALSAGTLAAPSRTATQTRDRQEGWEESARHSIAVALHVLNA